ncbi:hypothetical protein [Parvibaculum sp.]|uniref:hypothetical protein n=1 Tax=Parvibaculum sp. TaxID=2024848 RepID=UPI00321153E5
MQHQFAHIELWTAAGSQRAGKKRWSARQILEEMSRAPGACDHVERPAAPVHLFGCAPMELADELEMTAADLRDSRGRSTSGRARVLLAAVYSFPTPRSEARREEEASWARDVLAFNLRFFGEKNVRSVVAHTDETFFHIHVAVTAPRIGNRLAWEEVHPGLAAESGAASVGASPKARKTAYMSAMRSFQDRYFSEVAVKHGQSRIGPRRRRLDRGEWHAEQRVSAMLKKAAGRPLEDVLSADYWRSRFERAEREKAAAIQRANAAERQAAKLKRQVIRLLKKLKKFVLLRVRVIRKEAPILTPPRIRDRERIREFQRTNTRNRGMV